MVKGIYIRNISKDGDKDCLDGQQEETVASGWEETVKKEKLG